MGGNVIKVVRANEIKNIKTEMSKLFIDSFYDYFKNFNLNTKRLCRSFKNAFDMSKFYVVMFDNELIGIGACGNGVESTIKLKRIDFLFNLGFSKGNRAYKYFKLIFEERDYAFEIDECCGMIEFVAIKENYRNKRIGFTLINHMMCDNKYERYLAKVGDNNYSARKVLDNIEFEVFDEEKAKTKEKEDVGVETYFYMICENKLLNR